MANTDTVYVIWNNDYDDICCWGDEWNVYSTYERCKEVFDWGIELAEQEEVTCYEIVETTREDAYGWLEMYHKSEVWW